MDYNILEQPKPASLDEVLKTNCTPNVSAYPLLYALENSDEPKEGNGCLDQRIVSLLIPFGLMTLINDPNVSDRVLNGIKGLFS